MDRSFSLVGEIGGTKTFLTLVSRDGERAFVTHATERFVSAEHASLGAMCKAFLQSLSPEFRRIKNGTFAVPGAVIDGRCKTTNLPWVLDERELAQELGASRVRLLNDVQATAYGSLHLDPKKIETLQVGIESPHATISVVSAGTGMGQSYLVSVNGQYHPMATEGGHSSFAPQGIREVELQYFIADELKSESQQKEQIHTHVSVERVLSGPAIPRIYRFLVREHPSAESTAVRTLVRESSDPSAVIGAHALDPSVHGGKPDVLCLRTLRLFASMLAAEAGNVALKHLSRGGVMLAGGVCAKLLPLLKEPEFMQAFVRKGRFEGFLKNVPVKVLLDEQVGLVGAIWYALEQE